KSFKGAPSSDCNYKPNLYIAPQNMVSQRARERQETGQFAVNKKGAVPKHRPFWSFPNEPKLVTCGEDGCRRGQRGPCRRAPACWAPEPCHPRQDRKSVV